MSSRKQQISIIAVLLLILMAVFFSINYANWRKDKNKIYPNTVLAGINVGGMSVEKADALVQKKVQTFKTQGLVFVHSDKKINIPISVASFDADLSYSLISFDVDNSVQAAFGNHNQRSFTNYLARNFNLNRVKQFPILYTLDKDKLASLLRKAFPELDIAPQNAYFSVSTEKGKYILQKNQEKPGLTINYADTIRKIDNNVARLTSQPINLITKSSYPSITKDDLDSLNLQAEKIIGNGDFTLSLKSASSTRYWEINPKEIISWLKINKDNSGKMELSLDPDNISSYLKTHISPQVNRAPIRPRFEIVDNKVVSWQKGEEGVEVNLTKTAQQINKDWLAKKNSSELIMEKVTEDQGQKSKLDIKQDLGTGNSSFAYSPPNRIHNIKTGLNTLQGLLIKPGEEFSLDKALGKVDKASGYLPELVIKDNETIPEYGGGLCQIATTIFRTALAAGLPITMRQNHSYQVSYYKPTGTDATIYDPLPDLRFINNTGHYILIQGDIKGNELSFDFWGTSDGRVASTTAPVVYNLVDPPPTKLIPTTSLPPGKKKCTEGSHEGADAYFDYTVSYPNSTSTPEYKKRFYSHYEPWQAVCLVGEKATSTKATSSEITASSSKKTQ